MDYAKAKEILELNVKEAGKSMPPDVKDALLRGIHALKVTIWLEKHKGRIPPTEYQLLEVN